MPQLSSALGASHVTTALQLPASLFTLMSAGMSEMLGSSSSVMVMVKLAADMLPSASMAVYVTVVMPTE